LKEYPAFADLPENDIGVFPEIMDITKEGKMAVEKMKIGNN
jgi:hypothetical protein